MNQVLEDHLRKMPEDARARTLLAVNYASAGREEDAMREANMAMTLRPDESTVLYNVACIFGVMQKRDEAMEALKKAWKAGFKDADWVRRDSDLAVLHDHPEFDELYPPIKD
jgi:non-specific serine/threonine protein kinase